MKDRIEALKAIQENELTLAELDDIYKSDKEIVFAAVKKNGKSLQFASKNLKNDKEIALAAIKEKYCALEFASDYLKDDEQIIIETYNAFQHQRIPIGKISEHCKLQPIEYASERLQNSEEFLFKALKFDKDVIDKFPFEYRAEKFFMMKAVQINGTVIIEASPELKNDRSLVLAAARENGWFLGFEAFSNFRNDIEIAAAACANSPYLIDEVPEYFKQDKDFIITVLKGGDIPPMHIDKLDINILMQRDVILEVFNTSTHILLLADKHDALDEELLLEIIEKADDSNYTLSFICKIIVPFYFKRKTKIPPKEDFIEMAILKNPLAADIFNLKRERWKEGRF